MLRSLFPQIDWSQVVHVGFDLDGTLYDEFDFIVQAYRPVACRIAQATGQEDIAVYDVLTRRWLEKGSSYPKIFSETLQAGGVDGDAAQPIIRDCLADFRNCWPELRLSARTRAILDTCAASFRLFIVTDGNCALQRRKVDALGLGTWFGAAQIAISGCREDGIQKPSPMMLSGLRDALALRLSPQSVVFFGDRDVDRDFAVEAGFAFVRVHHMCPIPDPELLSETP